MSGSGQHNSQTERSETGVPTPAMRQLAEELAGTSRPAGTRIRHVPADVYLSTSRFVAEREALFNRLPVPLVPAVFLKPGESVTHDHYGAPLLVTRDGKGQAHVLLNVCKHRGTRLVESGDLQSVSRLVCPYHAWTYDLKGALKGLPRPETFPGLDKANYGLKAFPVAESGGLVWTRLDGHEFDPAGVLGDIARDFDALGLSEASVFDRRSHHVKANWKLIMDAFLESYHVQRLHSDTIATFFADSITAGDRVGLHFRSAVARQDYAQAAAAESLDALRHMITFSYSILPAMVVVASPDYVNVMLLYPQNTHHTLVEDYMLIPAAPVSDEEASHWAESFGLLDGGVFAAEDFRAAELGQRGLASGGLEHMTLGTAEDGVAEFHQTLDTLLADRDSAV